METDDDTCARVYLGCLDPDYMFDEPPSGPLALAGAVARRSREIAETIERVRTAHPDWELDTDSDGYAYAQATGFASWDKANAEMFALGLDGCTLDFWRGQDERDFEADSVHDPARRD
jgi:hypothetical protein